jgi:hypothetical protein
MPEPAPPRSADYLALLERRLAALAHRARGLPVSNEALGTRARDRALARRFLRPLEATWHDGDENLVRGYLDRWSREGEDTGAATARSLLAAADELAGSGARAATLWFFLWEMESVLESLAARSGPRRGGH